MELLAAALSPHRIAEGRVFEDLEFWQMEEEASLEGWTVSVVRAWHQVKGAWLVARVGEVIMGAGSILLGDLADSLDTFVMGYGGGRI